MNVKNEIYSRLKKLTKNKFDDSSSVFEIGIDSLDLVELVTEAEDEFKVEISDSDLENIKIVGDIVKTFEKVVK